MSEQDLLRRFLFDDHHVRGVWVHLHASYQAVLSRHPYPDDVAILLGQALAAAALLATTIKFDGALTLQCQSQHQLKLLLAKCTHDLHIRGLAHYAPTHDAQAHAMLANAQLIIAIDQYDPPHRYQSVVECQHLGLSGAIEHYFLQSEQLPTALMLASNQTVAAGLLLQQMPNTGETTPDAWQNILALTQTLQPDELLTDNSQKILTKLYHEHKVRVFEPQIVSFRCQCSIARMERALKMMPYDEVLSLLQTHQKVEVRCEFCNAYYDFDQVDIARIFKSDAAGSGTSGATH